MTEERNDPPPPHSSSCSSPRPAPLFLFPTPSPRLLSPPPITRALHDSLMVIKRMLESNVLVAGGGSVETALSIYLESFATTLGSREQLAIAEFAEALLVIPKTLAVNAAQVREGGGGSGLRLLSVPVFSWSMSSARHTHSDVF